MEISQGNSLCSNLCLKQAKMSCFSFYFFPFFSTKLENRRAEQVLPKAVGVWYQWEVGGKGEKGKDGEHGAKSVYTCM
jgi:hypothetical protein